MAACSGGASRHAPQLAAVADRPGRDGAQEKRVNVRGMQAEEALAWWAPAREEVCALVGM